MRNRSLGRTHSVDVVGAKEYCQLLDLVAFTPLPDTRAESMGTDVDARALCGSWEELRN